MSADPEAQRLYAEILREHSDAFLQLAGAPIENASRDACRMLLAEAFRLYSADRAKMPFRQRLEAFLTLAALMLRAEAINLAVRQTVEAVRR